MAPIIVVLGKTIKAHSLAGSVIFLEDGQLTENLLIISKNITKSLKEQIWKVLTARNEFAYRFKSIFWYKELTLEMKE